MWSEATGRFGQIGASGALRSAPLLQRAQSAMSRAPQPSRRIRRQAASS